MLILEFNNGKIILLFVTFSLLSIVLIHTVIAKIMPFSPKMATSCSPEPMNMLPNTTKRTLQKWLRILRWQDHLGLPRWVKCNHKGASKRLARGSMSERGDVTVETEVGVVHFENGHVLRRAASRSRNQQGNGFSPVASAATLVGPMCDFWPIELEEGTFVLFWALTFMAICYSCNGKRIYILLDFKITLSFRMWFNYLKWDQTY